jgi:Raf kinase inhibitor-like YbhB/YbcL family protein
MGGNSMRINARQTLFAVVLLSILVGAVAAAQQSQAPPPKFKLMTSAFAEGSMIPTQYSCADPNAVTPPLQWSGAPAATVSFALILHDTDAAPGKGTMDVTHWIFWNISGTSTSVAGNVKPDSSPDGIAQGKNVRGVNGYQPPCPPPGGLPHHYIFELFALDTKLDLAAGSSRADLLKAMEGHVIGKTAYFGLFGR